MSAPPAPSAPEAPSGSAAPLLRRTLTPVLLVRAAHPRQAALTALALAVAAAVSGRAAREVGLVLATVLVGQAVLGWDNDLVDEAADRAAERTDKPLATGALERGTVGFALACAVLLLVPLVALQRDHRRPVPTCSRSWSGVAGNRWLRDGSLSWLPWAVAFALYPAYLSYGGWGGGAEGDPPTIAMTAGRRRARCRRPRPHVAARPGGGQPGRPPAPPAAPRAAGRGAPPAGPDDRVLRGRGRASRPSSEAPSGCRSDPGGRPLVCRP